MKVLAIVLINLCIFISGVHSNEPAFVINQNIENIILQGENRTGCTVRSLYAFSNEEADYLILDVVVSIKTGLEKTWRGKLIARKAAIADSWKNSLIYYYTLDRPYNQLIHMDDTSILKELNDFSELWNEVPTAPSESSPAKTPEKKEE